MVDLKGELKARSDDTSQVKWKFVIGMEFLEEPPSRVCSIHDKHRGVDLVIRARELRANVIHDDPLPRNSATNFPRVT